jgi:hypothetical protein
MHSKFSSTPTDIHQPANHEDGTISAIIRDAQRVSPAGVLLRLWLPIETSVGGGFGRFFLARCAEDSIEARRTNWSVYSRRALYSAGMPTAMPDQAGSSWELLVPTSNDPGYQWLAKQPLSGSINLLGPFGQLFELTPNTRSLVVLADTKTLLLTLPVIHTMLDRGGRVTLLVQGQADHAAQLLPLIPIPVEVRIVPPNDWLEQLSEPVRWADQLCAALPPEQYSDLAHRIRTLRFRLDPTFAQVLTTPDMLCGVGACLACVVATREGSYTRACIHGPVFSLDKIAS